MLYRIGTMIRETGQALERVGCRMQGVDAFIEDIFRHRAIMNLESLKPILGANVFVAPNATVIGDVKIADNTSVWYGSVIRGDESKIEIGSNTNIQDGCTVGGTDQFSVEKYQTVIGNDVTIGHAASLNGCTIEDGCLIGMGATLMPRSRMEKGSMIASGAVVLEDTIVPSDELWAGNPAKFLRKLSGPEIKHLETSPDKYFELSKSHKTYTDKMDKKLNEGLRHI